MKRLTLCLGVFALIACRSQSLPTRAELHAPPMGAGAAKSTTPGASSAGAATRTPETATPAATRTLRATAPPPRPSANPQQGAIQLTTGGCCAGAFWSPDSRYVQFIDQPPGGPVGIYGVEVAQPGPPVLLSERLDPLSAGGQFYIYPQGNATAVEEVGGGETHLIYNGGRPVSVSPNGRRLLWQVFDRDGNFDTRLNQTFVANLDGSGERMVGETLGVSASEWIDAERVLLVGVPLEGRSRVGIQALILGATAEENRTIQLARVARPGEMSLSPDGTWLVYLLPYQDNPADDGLWILPTDGSAPPRKLGFFGAFRWRSDARLLYVPMELDAPSHTLWEYHVVDDESHRLTDPDHNPFRIANNNWAVSPNGRFVAFVSATDHNIYLLSLE